MSLDGLEAALPGHDAGPVGRLAAGRKESLQDRRLGLLDLEEERVVVVAAEQERGERAEPDAPDADDLQGSVDELVAVEEHAAVLADRVRGSRPSPPSMTSVVSVGGMGDDRGMVDDPAPALRVDRGQLRELVERVVMVSGLRPSAARNGRARLST